MKLLVAFCLIAMVAAAPYPKSGTPYNDVEILKYENENDGYGSYRFAFEQSDGTKHEQRGEVKNKGLDNEYIAMRGSFSWVGPDGVTYTVTYVADDNGFEPTIEQGPGGAVPHHVASLIG